MTTPLFMLRCVQLGISIADLERLFGDFFVLVICLG